MFFNSSETKNVVETAIKFEQKKVILQNRVICSAISNLSICNLLATYIDLLLAEKIGLILIFIIWLPVWETGNKCRKRDLKDISLELKKKVFIGHKNNSTDKG